MIDLLKVDFLIRKISSCNCIKLTIIKSSMVIFRSKNCTIGRDIYPGNHGSKTS